MSGINHLYFLLFIAVLTGCNDGNRGKAIAIKSISTADLEKHVSILASDDFGGRAPSTTGEAKTIAYLSEEFKKSGLEPANNGSYFQEVPLVKLSPDTSMVLTIRGTNSNLRLNYGYDFIGSTPGGTGLVKIDNSEVIFVGYGIYAPEYNWNDYAGIDVKGKTILMLVNDPGYATSDRTLFSGKEMTYYGRWTYKYEEAARLGARAAIIIHETGAAGYPWGVVRNSFSGPQFCLPDNDVSFSDLQFKAWITTESAKKIFESAGLDYDRSLKEASKRFFKPFSMNLAASVQFKNKAELKKSFNVCAIWPGTDRADEFVIYVSHWDHLGINKTLKNDSIFNGAADNASGTAALLEIAKAFTMLPERQNRSILFLSVTSEEQGLLGSEFYVRHPLIPHAKTAGVINMDALNIFGKSKDMTVIGYGYSGLDNIAETVLKRHGRYVRPDPVPEKGGFFRSDHFSFAKAGVPSLYLSKGIDNEEHGMEWGLKQSERWTTEHYHKPSDSFSPGKWNIEGMIEDIRIYFEIGHEISLSRDFPEWNPGTPFKSIRDRMMPQQGIIPPLR